MAHFHFYQSPALHPRLTGALEEDRAFTSAHSIADALEPGLAAEISTALVALPHQLRYMSEDGLEGICWRCDFALPGPPDPQYPEAFYRLIRFLDRDLPDLAGRITGRRWRNSALGQVGIWTMRKGSWLRLPAPGPRELRCILGLTGQNWPADWGGSLVTDGRQEDTSEMSPIGWDRLHLLRCSSALPLLRRHVEARFAMAVLEEVE
jgi:hypothetical protein